MVRTPYFHFRGSQFNPGWGIKMPQAVQCRGKKKTPDVLRKLLATFQVVYSRKEGEQITRR